MATCVQSITNTQAESLGNEVIVNKTIDTNTNALFIISSNQDQSIFLSLNVVGSYQLISITVTIYKKDTMQIFGSMTVTSHSTNSSFNIQSGEYYICIRSQLLSYNINFSAKYINYNTVATLNPVTSYGFESNGLIYIERPEYVCNQPLRYVLIDGELPTGLTMADNGYIFGTLPMLDVDDYNESLPTSNTWYERIHDSKYITPWGRAYRFKVRLYLKNNPQKFDDEWFYISIINDFNKNKRFVYEVLSEERIVSLEEQIKISTISLCKPCGTNESVSDEILYLPDVYNLKYMDLSGKIINPSNDITTSEGRFVADLNNLKYVDIESKITDLDDEIVGDYIDSNDYNNIVEEEMILIDPSIIPFYNGVPVIKSQYGDITDLYRANYDFDNDMIIQMKDSCMFQIYLMENNFDEKYIDIDVLNRFNYNKIKLDIIEFEGLHYIQLVNNNGIDYSIETDMIQDFDEMYIDAYSGLPLTTYAMFGCQMEATLK